MVVYVIRELPICLCLSDLAGLLELIISKLDGKMSTSSFSTVYQIHCEVILCILCFPMECNISPSATAHVCQEWASPARFSSSNRQVCLARSSAKYVMLVFINKRFSNMYPSLLLDK